MREKKNGGLHGNHMRQTHKFEQKCFASKQVEFVNAANCQFYAKVKLSLSRTVCMSVSVCQGVCECA